MKVENNKIVEATESELFSVYLKEGYDDIMSFPDYLYSMRRLGVVILEDK